MRWFKNLGLTFKLNLVVILTLSIVLAVLIAVTQTLDDFTLETSQQRVAQEVEVIQRRFAEVEEEMVVDTRILATTPGLAEAVTGKDEDAIRTTLLVGASRFRFDDVMDVVDANGNPVFVELAQNAPKNSQLARLRTLALIGSDAIALVVDEDAAEPNLRLAAVAPIRDTVSGQILGGLLTTRNVDGDFMAEINLEREDVHLVSIIEGKVLPDTFSTYDEPKEHQEISHFVSVLQNQAAISQAMDGQIVIGEDFVYAGGLPHMIAFMPLSVGGEINSVVGIMTQLGTELTYQRQFINNSSIVYVLLAVAAVMVIGVFAVRSISLPINKLRVAAEQFEQGDYQQRAEVRSGDEVGQLANSFNNMADQLQELIDSLENRVAQRTRRLEIVAALSEQLSAILNLEELLVQVVDQIQQNFGYYHAHIYLLNAAGDQLVMRAGTGSAGAQMKASGHHIALNAPTSLVARAARTGEVILVDNVRESADWLPNPLLPDTHSEMAVPIMDAEGRVLGVLDVQQHEVAGLDEGDVALLRSLANQVAVAIRNARLFTEVETALAEAREAQERYVEQSWQAVGAKSGGGHYRYTRPGVPALDETVLDEAKQQTLLSDHPLLVPINGAEDSVTKTDQGHVPKSVTPAAIAAAITVRDKAVGALRVYPASADQQWTENDLAIVEAVVNQLAQSAESLRLFDETRQRAGYEQTIREITDKLRRAPTFEALTQTAGEELAKILGMSHSVVKIGEPERES